MNTRITLLIGLALSVSMTPVSTLAHEGEVHGDEKPAAHAPPAGAPKRLPDGSVQIAPALQQQWGLATRFAQVTSLATTVELNGQVIADPDAGGRVQAARTGSVLPGPRGMPVPGRRVTKGETLLYLRAALDPIERGNQQAAIAQADADIVLAEARLARYGKLDNTAGAIPVERIEAERTTLEALKRKRRLLKESLDAPDALRAPASGVVSAMHVVAGQVVEAREVLVEIVDPQRLWVEALAYDARVAGSIRRASAAVDSTLPLELALVGSGRQLREQALPVLFRIVTKNPPVAVGQRLRVLAQTADVRQGVAMPRAALMKNAAGEDIVWLQLAPDRFAMRRVKASALDARHVAITAGLADGDEVVVAAAGLLSQVR